MLEKQHRLSKSLKKGCQLRSVIVKHNKVVWKHITETYFFQADTKTVFVYGKTCFLIVYCLIGHTQFRVVSNNVWLSKVPKGVDIDCSK